MGLKNVHIKKGRTQHRRLHGVVCFFIIIVMMPLTFPVQAEVLGDYKYPDTIWKKYPYHPPGTDIVFPNDEGSHNENYKIEWWYANFHLIGCSGHRYGAFVAFYQLDSKINNNQEVRIFSISDITLEKMYSNVQIGVLEANNEYLDLSFKYIADYYEETNVYDYGCNQNQITQNQATTTEIEYFESLINFTNPIMTKETTQVEIEKANIFDNSTMNDEMNNRELSKHDHWYTKSNNDVLLPFQYTLNVSGNSQQDSELMALTVDMDCNKKPLIVDGDGFLDLGKYGFSFYYSLTKLTVTGYISIHGITEQVFGIAWIDHQWGNFFETTKPPYGLALTYEWFSIQLDDNREIMFADSWDRETGLKNNHSFTGGMNILNSDGTFTLLDDYSITQLAVWNDSTDNRFYSSKWHVTDTKKLINLTIIPVFLNQVMRVKENYPIIQQLLEKMFPGACFWEGTCMVYGYINNLPVYGKAYVELTHYYNNEKS
jgi:predicted secreted hydrolase